MTASKTEALIASLTLADAREYVGQTDKMNWVETRFLTPNSISMTQLFQVEQALKALNAGHMVPGETVVSIPVTELQVGDKCPSGSVVTKVEEHTLVGYNVRQIHVSYNDHAYPVVGVVYKVDENVHVIRKVGL